MVKILSKIKKIIYLLLKTLFGVLLICFAGFFLFLLLDREGSCASDGKVWDPVQNVCRSDCLKWTEDDGCVPLPENYQK